MATERKRRRSTSPQRSPGELANTLAQMAAGTQDPPARRRRRFEIDPSLFVPPAEPAPRRSAVLAPERPRETPPSEPAKPPVLPEPPAAAAPVAPEPPATEPPATAPPATAPPSSPPKSPPVPQARVALVSDDVSGSALREPRPGTMSTTPLSPSTDRPPRPPAKPRVPRSRATRDAAPAAKDPSPPAPAEDAAGGLAIGSRLGSGSASPRTERKPISRISGRSSSGRTNSGRSKLRDRVAGRSGGLVTAQVAGSRFRSRASGQVGRRGSRASSRRPHLGRRFTLVVLSVIVLVLLALVLIDGSSNHHAAPASAHPAITPVPVPPGSDRSTTPAPPAATTPTPTAPTTTATTPHKTVAPAKHKAKAKAAVHKVKRTAHRTTTASTSSAASQPSTTPSLPAPVYRSPVPRYTPPPPARQSLTGVGSLSSGASTLSHRRTRHRKK